MNTNRRDFIKKGSSITAGLLAFAPWFNSIKAENISPKSPSDKVRLGVIGVGSRGNYLLLNLLNTPGVEIAAVCDNYEPNYQSAIQTTKGKAKGYYEYKKLLEDKTIDGVVIATPLHEHAHITVDAFNAGKHVFCEKAMARTYEQCNAMYNAKLQTGKLLFIGHQRMFNPRYLKAFSMVKHNEIGKISQIRAFWHRNSNWRRPVPAANLERKINWRLYKDYSCGLMTELASHHLQVANWFLGAVPVEVYGSGSVMHWKDGREVPDNVNLIYKYADGTHFLFDSITSNKFYGCEIQIMGPKGTIESESSKFYPEEPPQAPGILQLINNIEHQIFDAIPIGGASWIPESAAENKGEYIGDGEYKRDGTDLMLAAFANSIRSGEKHPEFALQGYLAGIACLMGYESIEEKRIIKWPGNSIA